MFYHYRFFSFSYTAPIIEFQTDSYTVNEAEGVLEITIVTNRLNVNGSALFYTKDGTATG